MNMETIGIIIACLMFTILIYLILLLIRLWNIIPALTKLACNQVIEGSNRTFSLDGIHKAIINTKALITDFIDIYTYNNKRDNKEGLR
jgi:ABC-type phosphate transport system permease subunit